MSKGTPPTPDYAALAREQGAANKETALAESAMNNPNETSPYGSRTWSATPDANGRYSVDTALSPGEQTKYDLQTQLANALLAAGGKYGMPALTDALNTNMTPPREAQLGWENVYAPDQRMQTESGMYEAPWIQEGLDFSGTQPIPVADQAMRQKMNDQLYGMATRYLDPQYKQQHEQMDSKLSNQGIFSGSDAYNDEQQRLSDQQARDYGDARDRAVAAGGDEMSRQYGLQMAGHQAGVSDISSQGAFANNARGQLINELQTDMQNRNAAIAGQANIATGQQAGSNQGTQAWIAQKAQSAAAPINVMTALMSGGQVNTPQFQPYNNSVQYAPPPIMQGGIAQGNANIAAGNASNASQGQWLQLGGAAMGAAALF